MLIAAVLAAMLVLQPVRAAAQEPVCEYVVRGIGERELALQIEARCNGAAVRAVGFAHPAARAFASIDPLAGDGRLRYRFALDRFIEAAGNFRIAMHRDKARLLTPSSWLAVPADAATSTRIELRWIGGRHRFATALPARGDAHTLSVANLRRAGYTVFGDFDSRVVRLPDAAGGADIEIVDLRASGPSLTAWIEDTAVAVSDYFGRFPVDRLLLVLVDGEGEGIDYGRVVSGGGATMLLVVGPAATAAALYEEWVLVHEMLHLGSPFMADGFWFMEGLATYAEPIIRARAGWRSERSVWSEFHRDMPRALPAFRRHGLARTRSAMYWGGALFMLLADLEYRRLSGGARGLEHCVRAALSALGNATVESEVAGMMDYCDAHFEAPVMRNLADRFVDNASPFDIDELWRELGLRVAGGGLVLDDDAPGASLRRAIMRRSANGDVDIDETAPDMFR